MTETILVGIVVATFSTLGGIAIGKLNRISREECKTKRDSCNAIVCIELSHIKKEQLEMKEDIKELLKRTKIS